jgi:hypothetical protein
MIPLNDGNMQLLEGNPNDTREASEIEPNRVFSRRIQNILPYLPLQIDDAKGSKKSMMRNGYEWMYNASSWKAIGTAIQQDRLVELKSLEKNNKAKPEEMMIEINALLMETAKDYYQKSKVKPKSLTVAIVRATDGKYYMGKHSKDGATPATPSAEFSENFLITSGLKAKTSSIALGIASLIEPTLILDAGCDSQSISCLVR